MLTSSLGNYGKRVHYKHLYYILQSVMLYGLMEMFIHHLTWSHDEVHKSTSHTKVMLEVKYWNVFLDNLTNFGF